MANSDEEKKDQSETPEEDSEETAPEEEAPEEESGAETSEADSDDTESEETDAEADDADEDEGESADGDDEEAEASDDSEDDEGSEDEDSEDAEASDQSDEDESADADDDSEADEAEAGSEEDDDSDEDAEDDDQSADDEQETADDEEETADHESDHDEVDEDDHEIAADDDQESDDDQEPDDSASHESRVTSDDEDDDILITERGLAPVDEYERSAPGTAAFFDHPDDLMAAARQTRDSEYEEFDAFSPFPIHGMDEAMGLGRSWIPWVTFAAGLTGFLTAVALEFGTMTFDWPLVIGGKPFAPWPAFVPVMFELTVLIGGVTTGVVMLKAAGCFEPADIIDPAITDDRFCLWIAASDDHYDEQEALEFARSLEPTEVRTYSEEADSDG